MFNYVFFLNLPEQKTLELTFALPTNTEETMDIPTVLVVPFDKCSRHCLSRQ